MFKVHLFSFYVYSITLRSANSQTNVKIDINGISDFQNRQEYINNKELGIFIFEIDVFINAQRSLFTCNRSLPLEFSLGTTCCQVVFTWYIGYC